MSRLSLGMTIPRLNLSLSRPIFSLLHACNYNCNHYYLNYNHNPLFFNVSLNNGNSNSKTLTPYFSTIAVSASRNASSPSTQMKSPSSSSTQMKSPSSSSTQMKSPSSSSTQMKSPSSSTPLLSKAKLRKAEKKARYDAPENVLKHKLDMCSKYNNLKDALQLYDNARANGTSLSTHNYNVLLYLCSLAANDGGQNSSGINPVEVLERGFEIFRQMGIGKIAPNEATFTSLARLAAAKEDPEMAFDFIKQMKGSGITPKLRSYGPALFGLCEKGNADKAFEVFGHMMECRVVAEELELSALLKVSSDTRKGDRVYEMLHRIRASVRQVSEETAKVVEDWFVSEAAAGVGVDKWDVDKVKGGVIRGGGGWHGQGWLGSGKWKVAKAEMDKTGVCSSCGEKLVCIDIDPKETENFARSLSSLAYQKEKKANFSQFQEWLRRHGPFDAVVDGANVGLINTKFFSFRQLSDVLYKLQQISPSKKLPLIVLHRSRVYGGPADRPQSKKLVESWMKSGVLYATPPGSNDDWYWLYAAVSNKCLMVTNDEMRDHLFQLLGNSIFPRWKEKHQVRMTVSRSGLDLHMPPPYSNVIQESEGGSWHVPTVTGDDLETPRQWLCATRATKFASKVKRPLSQLLSKR